MLTHLIMPLIVLAGLTWAVWPGTGILSQWRRARQLGVRVRREDALKHILKAEINGRNATLESVAGSLQISRNAAANLLEDLEAHSMISFEAGEMRLEPAGRDLALQVVRAHRLWESYLAEETGVAEAEWHRRAEQQEHLLSPQETDALAARLGNPPFDPHGDPIPAIEGEIAGDRGQPLNGIPEHTPVLITHIEDEPQAVYAQLIAQGLRPGMKAMILEKQPARVRFWADGNSHLLAPVVANNIFVEPLPGVAPQQLLEEEHLTNLQTGQTGKVIGLSPACRGAERRRLLDLGFVPGTTVAAEMTSPGGDPTAYRLRGTLVALRREQAALIKVSINQPAAA